MAVLLVGHIGAALYHHFVRQDEVLQRMLRGEVSMSGWCRGYWSSQGRVEKGWNWVAECNNLGGAYIRKNVFFLRWRGERYIPKNVFFLR